MKRVFIALFFITSGIGYFCRATNACSNIRDPFTMPEHKKKLQTKQPIMLEGIVYAGQKRSAAVLVCGDVREVVERGERFLGHQVIMICKDFVVIARGKQKQKLFIE